MNGYLQRGNDSVGMPYFVVETAWGRKIGFLIHLSKHSFTAAAVGRVLVVAVVADK